MFDIVPQAVYERPALLLPLVLLALVCAAVLVGRIREESRRLDLISALMAPPADDHPESEDGR